MKAYKFLLSDRVAPFSGFAWPVGEWVESPDGTACNVGIHACESRDLPYWLLDELWEIELGDPVERGRHKVVAHSGRLGRRIEGWDERAREDFTVACVERARELEARRAEASGHLTDLATWAPHVRPAAIASIVARTFEAVEGDDGYDRERAAQASWLVDRLGLDAGA